jgi:hypothetical protein
MKKKRRCRSKTPEMYDGHFHCQLPSGHEGPHREQWTERVVREVEWDRGSRS